MNIKDCFRAWSATPSPKTVTSACQFFRLLRMSTQEPTEAKELRRRQRSRDEHARLTTGKDEETSATAAVPKTRRARPIFQLMLTVVAALSLSLIFRGRVSSLPNTFAVCSPEKRIYTVDEEQPRAECILVHESRIIAIRSLGELFLFSINVFHASYRN